MQIIEILILKILILKIMSSSEAVWLPTPTTSIQSLMIRYDYFDRPVHSSYRHYDCLLLAIALSVISVD